MMSADDSLSVGGGSASDIKQGAPFSSTRHAPKSRRDLAMTAKIRTLPSA